MTERDRLLAVLDGRAPDRTPWYGDLSWWHHASHLFGTLPGAYCGGGAGYLRMHRDAGVGIYVYAPAPWTEEYDGTVGVETTAGVQDTVTTLTTPHGALRSVVRKLPESATSAVIEHLVKAPDDLPAVRHLFEHRVVRANDTAFRETDAEWGRHGLPVALGPICTTGLQIMLTRWAGVETTIALIADAREEFERTIGTMQESDDPVFGVLCQGSARCVEFPENLSGEVTGPRLLRRYAMPYWRRRIAQLHAAGKSVGIHNDGTLRGSLDLLVEAGFDFVEAVTPAPVGDMPLADIRRITAGRTIVWGGLPGAVFSRTTPDRVFRETVRDALAAFAPGSGFVLGVADQVPPDADFARICEVREIVDRYG